jgi:hypothetical protein
MDFITPPKSTFAIFKSGTEASILSILPGTAKHIGQKYLPDNFCQIYEIFFILK